MTNSIDDLKGFMEAVENHHESIRKSVAEKFDMKMPKDSSEWLMASLKDILNDSINEADYIAKWSEHDTN